MIKGGGSGGRNRITFPGGMGQNVLKNLDQSFQDEHISKFRIQKINPLGIQVRSQVCEKILFCVRKNIFIVISEFQNDRLYDERRPHG